MHVFPPYTYIDIYIFFLFKILASSCLLGAKYIHFSQRFSLKKFVWTSVLRACLDNRQLSFKVEKCKKKNLITVFCKKKKLRLLYNTVVFLQ